MSQRILAIGISVEQDLVIVRQRARQISALLGFGAQDQVRIATATSELSRNALGYSSGGRVEFLLDEDGTPPTLNVLVKTTSVDGREQRPLAGLEADLAAAIASAGRLMDGCSVESARGRSSSITLKKFLPDSIPVSRQRLAQFGSELDSTPANTYAEIQLQNKELLDTLAELRARQDELLELTRELEDTNRGVVALYAEIESKAERLRAANASKTRFLSNTSHELRTPLSSIRALAQLLLDHVDGDLTPEQEKQVGFISRAAGDLSELVNDLLDLARIESGKVVVNRSEVSIKDLFRALRGAMNPLLGHSAVALLFEAPSDDMVVETDELKLSQILRNFMANAIRFTEQGSITVFAEALPDRQLRIAVRDTGIGIALDQQLFVFEEFSQIPHTLQDRSKGTGLGLALCRTLASLLGGSIQLQSVPGEGSTFSVILPLQYSAEPKFPADTGG